MEQSINWLPTIITTALISVAIFIFVWKWKKMDEKFLTKTDHEKLCQIAHLQFQRHVSEQMTELKEGYLDKKFKELVDTINHNGGAD